MKRKIEKRLLVNRVLVVLVVIALVAIFIINPFKLPLTATKLDYEQLENQVALIKENPELLLSKIENNITITVTVDDEITTVTFENDICGITEEYNKQSSKPFSRSEYSQSSWVTKLVATFLLIVLLYYLSISIYMLICSIRKK